MDFKVLDFNPLLSDVHRPISFDLPVLMGMKLSKSKPSSLVKKQNNKRIKIPKWDSSKKKDFISNLDLEQVSYVSLFVKQ